MFVIMMIIEISIVIIFIWKNYVENLSLGVRTAIRTGAEKQIPIRPYIVDDEYKGEYCICSNCYEVIGYIDDYKLKQCQKTYCQNCGQKIELSEVAK